MSRIANCFLICRESISMHGALFSTNRYCQIRPHRMMMKKFLFFGGGRFWLLFWEDPLTYPVWFCKIRRKGISHSFCELHNFPFKMKVLFHLHLLKYWIHLCISIGNTIHLVSVVCICSYKNMLSNCCGNTHQCCLRFFTRSIWATGN